MKSEDNNMEKTTKTKKNIVKKVPAKAKKVIAQKEPKAIPASSSAKVYNQSGKETGNIKLPETIFGLSWNGDLVHQVVTSMKINEQEPWAHTKTRGEVAGGGKKPWQQKGTGRARHGSIRSPIWVGGGVSHGPNNLKNFSRKVNKKMKTKALFVALSRKLKDGEIMFVDKLSFDKPKTKEAREMLLNFVKIKNYENLLSKKNNSAMFIFAKSDEIARKSLGNFSNITTNELKNINVIDVMNHKFLIVVEPKEAVTLLSAKLSVK